MEVKRIESYGLGEFLEKVIEAIGEGYSFDFKTNENYPTAFGGYYTCGMLPRLDVTNEGELNVPTTKTRKKKEE